MAVVRYSHQREAILNDLRGRKDHPSAEAVYESVKKRYPNISLGTVYRNLAQLAEMGEIQKIVGSDESIRYDGDAKPHLHFKCERCKQVSDLENRQLDLWLEESIKSIPGKVSTYGVLFSGVCMSCLDKQEV